MVAAYNPVSNQFTLTNTATGNVGISVKDLTGNFLAATGLTGGTPVSGHNLQYTLDNGTQLSSQTNTILPASSGVTGLTVTPLNTGKFTVTVAPDTSTIASAITKFVTDYNSAQSTIDAQTATSTDSSGNVTAGPLTGDQMTEDLNSNLRSLATSTLSGLSGTMASLNDLGFASNGQNDTLLTSDTVALTSALTTNLSGVAALFSNPTNGLAAQINSMLNDTIGTNGTLTTEQLTLTTETSDITTHISDIETQCPGLSEPVDQRICRHGISRGADQPGGAYLTRAFPTSTSS